MRWFRFYSQALHDSKVQTLPADLFRAWVNLLCIANDNDDRGTLPGIDQIAYSLHIKEDKAAKYVEQLIQKGLISEDERGSLRPHNWDKWQHKSDNVTDRVREHRRRKDETVVKQNETFHRSPRNVSETPRVRDHAGAPAGADSETETETEEKTPPPPPGGGAPSASASNGFASPPDPDPFAALVEQARGEFDDRAALVVAGHRADIVATLGGRFDCYLAALRAAKASRKPINNLHSFAMALARKYLADGIPGPPVEYRPEVSRPKAVSYPGQF